MAACGWTPSYVQCHNTDSLDSMSDEDRAAVEQMATDLLWNWTGHVFGACPVEYRPCRQNCGQGGFTASGWASNSPWSPALVGGEWRNVSCGSCGDNCGCGGSGPLRLPWPVSSIEEILIDGEVLPDTAYRVDSRGLLQRTDGGVWPTCFPAGTLVTTRQGQMPIEDVVPGVEVLTHEGRWRPVVTNRYMGIKDTVTIGARGPLTLTPDHKVWVRRNESESTHRRLLEPEWAEAATVVGGYVARASNIPVGEVPKLPSGRLSSSDEFWTFVGFWLGDGWVEKESRRIRFGVKRADKKALLSTFAGDWRVSASDDHAIWRLRDDELADWLTREFGAYAHGKKIPGWLLMSPASIKEAFIEGLMQSDGHFGGREARITTTSKDVAVSVGLILNSIGLPASTYLHRSGHWQIAWVPSARERHYVQDERAVWSRVRSIKVGETVPVYDIEVEEDHSFIADGFVVHNCQNLALPVTEPGTWQISYLWGLEVPVGGQMAAGLLAAELAMSLCNDNRCQLPQRIQSITRQGITVTLLDRFEDVAKGRTGIWAVDAWVASVTKSPRGARVYSPDLPRKRFNIPLPAIVEP